MSDERRQSMFIVAYEGKDTADQVYETLRQLEKDKKVDIKTAMVVRRKDNGKLKLVHKRRVNTWGGAALGGGLALLLGAASGGVLAGIVIGAALGGFGHKERTETKEFLEDRLGPDDSAVAILIKDADWEAVDDAIEKYGGKALAVEMTDEAYMQAIALFSREEVAEAVAEEVEVEDEPEE